MAELQQAAIKPELYERLINRLGQALDVANTAVRLRDEAPAELVLRGLSPAEFELIEAYLDSGAFGFVAERVMRSSSAARELDGPTSTPLRSAKVIWLNNQQRAKASAKIKSSNFR
ncbi:hypothetical protein [Pseudomonas sp. NA-150]|uniref:hypothetical protein n=1 Tax=Pseudomonas sp. NA-150 TaxID=3367525 RepID=UPI0037C97FCB